jgi:hypothetical protein
VIRTWTFIGVADVARSLRGYQALLGRPPAAPAHEEFGPLTDADATVLPCLHRWGDHEHPTLCGPLPGGVGNGLLPFFRLEACECALRAAGTWSPALAGRGIDPRPAPGSLRCGIRMVSALS